MVEAHPVVPEHADQLRAYVEQLLAERARYAAALAQSHDLIARLLALDEEAEGCNERAVATQHITQPG
jgi:hypothetical protein